MPIMQEGRLRAARAHDHADNVNDDDDQAAPSPRQRKIIHVDMDAFYIALALNGKFVQVHRVGNVDGDNEFDVDGGRIVFALGLLRLRARRRNACDVTPGYRSCDQRRPD